MPDITMLMIGGGVLGLLAIVGVLFSGPSATKSRSRRLESVRERHSRSSDVAAHAQLKKIMANRAQISRAEGLASSLIPNPELLRKRLRRASHELAAVAEYDYAVMNEDLEAAVGHVSDILDGKADEWLVSRQADLPVRIERLRRDVIKAAEKI